MLVYRYLLSVRTDGPRTKWFVKWGTIQRLELKQVSIFWNQDDASEAFRRDLRRDDEHFPEQRCLFTVSRHPRHGSADYQAAVENNQGQFNKRRTSKDD